MLRIHALVKRCGRRPALQGLSVELPARSLVLHRGRLLADGTPHAVTESLGGALMESGAAWVYQIARFNPFTHAVAWLRFALCGKDPGLAPYGWGYDPQRGFGALTKRGGPA